MEYSTIPCMEAGSIRTSLYDTLKIAVRVRHEPLATREFLPLGVKRARSSAYYSIPGAHKQCAITAASSPDGAMIYLEGSFIKYLTGQNVFGSEGLHPLCLLVIQRVLKKLDINPTPKEIRAIKAGKYRLLRVDYATHCDCGAPEAAVSLARAIKNQLFHARQYSCYDDYHVQYLNQHSTRSTLKLYLKGAELQKHGVPETCRVREHVQAIAPRLLRMELTLRSPELKRLDLQHPAAWNPYVAQAHLEHALRSVTPGLEARIGSASVSCLTTMQQAFFALHQTGGLGLLAVSKGVLARQRNAVMKTIGYDLGAAAAPLFPRAREVFRTGTGYAGMSKELLREIRSPL